MYKNPQRTFSGSSDLFAEPLTPPGSKGGQRRNGGDDANEFSPGLLDLHAFDTELIPEVIAVFRKCILVLCLHFDIIIFL